MRDSYVNLYVSGNVKEHFEHDIDSSNTVNGKPVYYYCGLDGDTIQNLDAGHITVAWSNNVFVTGCSTVGDGLRFIYTHNSDIFHCTATDCVVAEAVAGIALDYSSANKVTYCNSSFNRGQGILMRYSTDNTVHDCIIESNGYNRSGIRLIASNNNTIYHNNIINNHIQVSDTNPINNNWHHLGLLEGNYWSDYTGLDDGSGTDKHSIAEDGIGDTLIPHPKSNFDFYPLMTMKVLNKPPIALCKEEVALVVDNSCCVTVHVEDIDNGFFDPDGSEDIKTITVAPTELCGTGNYMVTLTIEDQAGEVDTCETQVTVLDSTIPDINISASPDELWPPNHKLVDVTISGSITDNCNIAEVFYTVTSDQPEEGPGKFDIDIIADGVIALDNDGIFNEIIKLRAERWIQTENTPKRTYTIIVNAIDESGNHSNMEAYVIVPHSKGKK